MIQETGSMTVQGISPSSGRDLSVVPLSMKCSAEIITYSNVKNRFDKTIT